MFSFRFGLFLFFTFEKTMLASEPQCSPFHYQEQMIEKMIKLEILVQKMKADMDATQQRVLEMTQHLDDNVTLLKSEWDAERTVLRNDSAVLKRELEEQIKANVQEMEEIRGTVKRPSVDFHAKDLKNTSPGNDEILVYATTLLNEGQGYDNMTGKFTAPVTGTYLFTAQFCLSGGIRAYIFYAFVSQDTYIKRGVFNGSDANGCYTTDVVTVIKAGAQVWITCTRLSMTTFVQNNVYWNTFSGVLMP